MTFPRFICREAPHGHVIGQDSNQSPASAIIHGLDGSQGAILACILIHLVSRLWGRGLVRRSLLKKSSPPNSPVTRLSPLSADYYYEKEIPPCARCCNKVYSLTAELAGLSFVTHSFHTLNHTLLTNQPFYATM